MTEWWAIAIGEPQGSRQVFGRFTRFLADLFAGRLRELAPDGVYVEVVVAEDRYDVHPLHPTGVESVAETLANVGEWDTFPTLRDQLEVQRDRYAAERTIREARKLLAERVAQAQVAEAAHMARTHMSPDGHIREAQIAAASLADALCDLGGDDPGRAVARIPALAGLAQAHAAIASALIARESRS